MLLTDAPLEPDPLFEGGLCDRCKKCVAECSTDAISTTEAETITVAGRSIQFAGLDVMKCSAGCCGGNPAYDPSMSPDIDPDSYCGKYCGGAELAAARGYPDVHHRNAALEGARGCIRACMVHLEERGVLKNQFVNPFRTRKPWRLEPE